MEERSVKAIIASLGGSVMQWKESERSDVPASILAELPADSYRELLPKLEELGIVASARPPVSLKSGERITVKIVLHGDHDR